jgi:hypothetical protein
MACAMQGKVNDFSSKEYRVDATEALPGLPNRQTLYICYTELNDPRLFPL